MMVRAVIIYTANCEMVGNDLHYIGAPLAAAARMQIPTLT